MLAQEPHSDPSKAAASGESVLDQFPISKTVTGVVLDLEPGGLRELHWHPTSDEWQYVIDGQVSVTMFGSHGRYRTETLNQGDVGYIPQGYGHSIENVGDKPCRVLIGFNTGHYQAIDLSLWIAGNPVDVLATNFGKPHSRGARSAQSRQPHPRQIRARNRATSTSRPRQGADQGKLHKGILVLEGNQLQICPARPGDARPTEASSKEGSGHILLVLEPAESKR